MTGRALLFVTTVAVFACTVGEPVSESVPIETRDAEALAAGIRIANALAADTRDACGSGSYGTAGHIVFAVSARQCLSCRNLGLLLRKAARSGEELTVVTPMEDVPAVCKFLKQEKLRPLVVGLPGALFPDSSVVVDPLLIAIQSDSVVVHPLGRDVSELPL